MQNLLIVNLRGHHGFYLTITLIKPAASPPKFSGRFDAEKLFTKNYDMLFANDPANNVIEPHRYDTDKIGVIAKGRLMLTVEGATTTITGASQWCHAPADKEHSA